MDREIYQYGISPNKWIEYMYAGRPILLAYNGASRVFNTSDCGWQVSASKSSELKGKILEIHSLPKAILDQKGKNGRKYLLSELNYNKLAKELYESLQECEKNFGN